MDYNKQTLSTKNISCDSFEDGIWVIFHVLMHTTVAVVHDRYFSFFFFFLRKPTSHQHPNKNLPTTTPIALFLVHYKSASVLLRGNKEQRKRGL